MMKMLKGKNGLIEARRFMDAAGGEYLSYAAIDEALVDASKVDEDNRKAMASKRHGRCIYMLKHGCTVPEFDQASWRTKRVPFDGFKGEINIAQDRVLIANYRGGIAVTLIRDAAIAQAFRAWFEGRWTA
jgi:hypothetical protein